MSRFFRLRPLDLDLGDMLVQIVAVAIGVILGLAATGWTEQVRQRALLRETVANIVQELTSNQKGLRSVMPGHARALAIVEPLAARGRGATSISLAQASAALKKMGNFRENVPLAIAWQIAQNDQGLTLLPYEDRYGLAWVYQLQTIYYENEERYKNSLLSLAKPSDGDFSFEVANFTNQLHAVVLLEGQLDAEYTGALAKAKSEFGAR